MKKFEDPILQALPFPIWEEDYSEIKKKLQDEGIWGLETPFFLKKLTASPLLVEECVSLLKVIRVNEACLSLYQLPSLQALENYFFDNFAKYFKKSFIDELGYLNEGKTKFEILEELLTPENTKKNIRLDFVVLDPDLKQVLVQITDITQEVASNKKIESLLMRNEMALKTTRAAVWEWNILTNETYWSDEYYHFFGIEQGEKMYSFDDWSEKIHPEDQSKVINSLHQAIENNFPYWEMEYKIKVPQKGTLSVSDKASIIFDDNGQAVKMVGVIHDITHQKAILDKLTQQNEFIETVLENLPIGVAANYMDTGKVKLINKNFTEIYGWGVNELSDVNTFFKNVYPDPEYRDQIKSLIMSGIGSGNPEKMNWTGIEITTKSGQKKIVSAKNIPLYHENLMISTVNDETNLHRAIHDLEQFAYIVSHDLQEPLRMISSFLSLLQKKYEHGLDDKAKAYINYAVDGGNRMKDMINNLLEYSRVDRIPEKQEYLNLNELIQETQSLLKVLIEESSTQFDIQENLPVVKFSKSLLIQVFQNLISNAIQNSKEGENPLIRIYATTNDHEVKIEVKDNGIGIPDEKKDKVFQLFQSFGKNSKTKKRGIGLAICKKIIERSGGKIWVESDGKTGSSFYFTLANLL